MLCEICGENEATFHYSEVIDGNKTEHHLCSECAARTDISYYSSLFDNGGRLGQLLSGLLGTQFFGGGDDPKAHVVCPGCGLSYGEFIKNSAFGCAECYNVFGPLLDESIKKIQGSTSHQGKKPRYLYHQEEQTEDKKDSEEETFAQPQGEKDSPEQLSLPALKRETDLMSRRLKEVVKQEDFEEAARLRDKIRELKQQIERISDNA